MRIEVNGSVYEGNYIDIISQMESDNLLEKGISTMKYANDLEYLILRFFDKDVNTETSDLEEKCKGLVEKMLQKGIAKRLD